MMRGDTQSSRRRTRGGRIMKLHEEPRLTEIFDEPIFDLLMRRDQVTRDQVERLISDYRRAVRSDGQPASSSVSQ